VRRSFTRGELKHPKTEASIRAVPLQARALDALDRIRDGDGSPLLFPGERGGYLDIHHFRPFQWRPAQKVIDRHYGLLARDGREHAIKLLDALSAPDFDAWTLVDARWTPKQKNGVNADNDTPDTTG
jgi:hypothetical protein